MRIPKRIVLPFGYVITIKFVPPKDEALLDHDTGEYLDGSWNADTQIIAVKKTLHAKRRRYILTHELGHAYNDFVHWAGDQRIIDQ